MDIDPTDIRPPGVELRDPADFDSLRSNIYNGVLKAAQQSFPVKYGGARLELHDPAYEGPEKFSLADQKKAILEDKYLARKLRGTVKLVDDKTGDVLDEKRVSLMNVPHLTERGTFIHNGSEYATVNQARLLPGVYTRIQANGALETQLQVRPGTGSSFRVGLEPDTAQYRLKIHQASLHLYSLLKDIGVPDQQLEKEWGPDMLALNKAKYDPRVLGKAYERLVPKRDHNPDASDEEKARAIHGVLERVQVHEGVARQHLPGMFDQTKAAEWQARWAGICAAEDELDRQVFEPELPFDTELFKRAATEEFDPTLDNGELRDDYNRLYGKSGPRLAGMKAWPKSWFPPGSDQLGWLSWYRKYADGHRTDDDARQKKRWKRFRQREVPKFVRSPTARRALSLRLWAIDPLKLLDSQEQKDTLEEQIKDFKSQAEKRASADWSDVESRRLAAREETESPKSVEQAEAGNYPKGRFWWNGLLLAIETAKGTDRTGVDRDGTEWRCRMTADYGHVLGTISESDGDQVDVFIGSDLESPIVWVVDQYLGKRFDEHKAVLGVWTEEEARKVYNSNYAKGWKGLRTLTPLTIPQFKTWVDDGDTGSPLAQQDHHIIGG